MLLFAKQTNPNQSNRRSSVQWYFPLQYSLANHWAGTLRVMNRFSPACRETTAGTPNTLANWSHTGPTVGALIPARFHSPVLRNVASVVDDLTSRQAGVTIEDFHRLRVALHAPVVHACLRYESDLWLKTYSLERQELFRSGRDVSLKECSVVNLLELTSSDQLIF